MEVIGIDGYEGENRRKGFLLCGIELGTDRRGTGVVLIQSKNLEGYPGGRSDGVVSKPAGGSERIVPLEDAATVDDLGSQ
jgi:hypothetical protein